MKQLITASRIGLKTSLKWLVTNNQTIVSAIKAGGEEVEINTKEDLQSFYTENTSGVPLDEYFKEYRFTKTKTLQEKNKTEIMKNMGKNFIDAKLPENAMKPEDIMGIPTPMEPEEEVAEIVHPIVNEVKEDEGRQSTETLWRLVMFRGDEEVMLMEFEDESDLHYIHLKWKEKYPSCVFEKQTVHSTVFSKQI